MSLSIEEIKMDCDRHDFFNSLALLWCSVIDTKAPEVIKL